MKTLILTTLILIGANCFGQDSTSYMYHDVDTVERLLPELVYVIDTLPDNEIIESVLSYQWGSNDTIYNNKWIFERAVILVMLKQYSEYETECYNDSTQKHTYTEFSFHNCYKQTGNLATGYGLELSCSDSTHYEWVHKQPNSPFMKWLRTKYK